MTTPRNNERGAGDEAILPPGARLLVSPCAHCLRHKEPHLRGHLIDGNNPQLIYILCKHCARLVQRPRTRRHALEVIEGNLSVIEIFTVMATEGAL